MRAPFYHHRVEKVISLLNSSDLKQEAPKAPVGSRRASQEEKVAAPRVTVEIRKAAVTQIPLKLAPQAPRQLPIPEKKVSTHSLNGWQSDSFHIEEVTPVK